MFRTLIIITFNKSTNISYNIPPLFCFSIISCTKLFIYISKFVYPAFLSKVLLFPSEASLESNPFSRSQVSGIPSPGAVGVTEGAFTEIFRNIYPENIMSSAVLLNRGINFYLLVLVSGIITIISHMNSEKIENQEEK